jgi:hypothetical protein
MAYGKLVDMELEDEEAAEMPMPIKLETPRYPFNLCICLTKSDMDKLGLDASDASVGDVIDMRAFGEVTSISKDRVEIQIQKLALENETEEEPGEEDDD